MMSDEITGTLKQAHWDVYGSQCVWGFLYGDVRDRWPDGTFIHTSRVVGAKRGEKPEIIKTLNSTYRVDWLDETEHSS
jgi:hypothetical protein